MTRPYIVAGCPIAQRAWAVDEWVSCLRSQVGVDVEIVALYSPSTDDTLERLKANDVRVFHDDSPPRRDADMVDHRWEQPHYRMMARLRNTLESQVWESYPDVQWWLSVDSDIMLADEMSLHKLVSLMRRGYGAVGPITSMHPTEPVVNWMHRVSGSNGAADGQYRRPGNGADYLRSEMNRIVEVDAIFGVKLCRASVARLVDWEFHGQGEDLGWADNASVHNVVMAIDTSIRAEHRMKPV